MSAVRVRSVARVAAMVAVSLGACGGPEDGTDDGIERQSQTAPPPGPNGLGRLFAGLGGLGLGVTGPNGLGRTGTAATGVGRPASGAGNGTGAPDDAAGGPGDSAAFARRFAQAACDSYLTRCVAERFGNSTFCYDSIEAVILGRGDVSRGVAAGRVVFDAVQGEGCIACVESTGTMSCLEVEELRCSACEGVFRGTVPRGGACVTDEECASDGGCDYASEDESDRHVCF